MAKYKIYAGLDGGFGGATYQYTTEEGYDEDAAMNEAYYQACDIFESQIGSGMDGYEEWRTEAESNIDFDDLEEDEIEDAINEYMTELEAEARENWIEYYVIQVDEDENEDDEDYELDKESLY